MYIKFKFLIYSVNFSEIDGRFHALEAEISHSERISVFSNGSLKINNVQKKDEGIYECQVTNEVGNPLKKSAVLKVIGEK